MTNRSINIKYALLQTGFFSTFCILMGYATNYLSYMGLEPVLIGGILAAGNLFSTLLQPLIASIVDKKHIPLHKLLLVSCVIMILFSISLIFIHNSIILLTIIYVLLITLLNVLTPLIYSLAFAFEKLNIKISFGLARGLGSASYAVTSLIMGYIIKKINPVFLPLFYIAIFASLIPLLNSFRLKGKMNKKVIKEEADVLKEETAVNFFQEYRKFMIFLAGAVLVFFTHTLINNFMIYVIRGIHGTDREMGIAVFMAALIELPAMAAFDKFKEKIDISLLLKISAVMFTVKHILAFLATNVYIFYLSQIMQCAAYAIFVPASVYYINKRFEEKDAVKGQSFATMVVTLGGIFASFIGGILIQNAGISMTLLIGAIISIIGTVIMVLHIENVS